MTPLANFFQLKSYLLCGAFHDCTGLPNALAHGTSPTVQTLDLFLIASFPNDSILVLSHLKPEAEEKVQVVNFHIKSSELWQDQDSTQPAAM